MAQIAQTPLMKQHEEMTYEEPLMIVKITVFMANHSTPEDVIYYRYKLPMNITLRYRWYFDYLAALVKVHNPKRKVELLISRWDDKPDKDKILCGKDYIDTKTASLIKGKKARISMIRNKRPSCVDLFDFERTENEEKIATLQSEIDALERGEVSFYVFPEYVNKIKKWIKK